LEELGLIKDIAIQAEIVLSQSRVFRSVEVVLKNPVEARSSSARPSRLKDIMRSQISSSQQKRQTQIKRELHEFKS